MPWSGGSFTRTNGVNTGATLWAQDRDDGTKILATRHDTNDQDMADGINSTLEKSGSNAATGNLDIGSNRITLVADGTAKTDVATVNQIQSNGPAFQATDTGTANAYVIALSPAITAYAAGQEITFKAGAASTTASTLNVNTLGTKALKKLHDQDIEAGDIESGSIVTAVYDGTNFQVTSQLASAGGGTPGGSNTQVQYNSSDTFAGDADLTFDGTELTAAGVNLAAFSGVLEANAAFVDQVIFGPSVDGMAWSGLWSKASVFSSLMLATVEDAGADSQINIWDLTTKANTTPLGTVTLSGDATPTSIAAAMGYLIVGSEDGITIIDPHSGAWAERTAGWPRTLSSSTVPALTNNDVVSVCAGLSDQPAHDPRTGGPFPTFGLVYGTGADCSAIIKDDGTSYDQAGTVGGKGCAIFNGFFIYPDTAAGRMKRSGTHITGITADDWGEVDMGQPGSYPEILGSDQQISFSSTLGALCDANGLSLVNGLSSVQSGQGIGMSALINRTYNTGYLPVDIRSAWLANSDVTDRSYKANTLTKTGTITEAAVETSAELNGYSGFNTSNYLGRANDSDFNFGTADYAIMGWFKQSAATGSGVMIEIGNTGLTAGTSLWFNSGVPRASVNDGSTTANFDTGVVPALNVWHQWVYINDQTNDAQRIYIDGVLAATDASSGLGSMTIASSVTRIGISCDDTSNPASVQKYALIRVTTTAPTATQIRQMYDSEKGLFVASAECLLQSGSTDAVLDVNVDPLTSKVLVTQTDAITVFDGLVVDSKPTVNSGSSEKGKLWGDLRTEQNSANAYVTAPAVDQRQVNEMVRGLASDLPKGVDLSKAKAWLLYDQTGPSITASYNVKSVTDNSTGNYTVNFAVPFKSAGYTVVSNSSDDGYAGINIIAADSVNIKVRDNGGTLGDAVRNTVVCFGELENE
jgi:hypothetical protein